MFDPGGIEKLKGKYIRAQDLEPRYFNTLKRAGLHIQKPDVVGKVDLIPAVKLAKLPPDRLITIRNFGPKGVKALRACLLKMIENK